MKTKSAKPTEPSDKALIDFINRNEAWVTYASDSAGTARAWRCHVAGRHFASPDRRERTEATAFGRTAADAIKNCMAEFSRPLPAIPLSVGRSIFMRRSVAVV